MKYVTRDDGEWFPFSHRLACCDCGLIHKLAFKIVKGKLYLQAIRDNRATAQRRRTPKTATIGDK